MPIQLTALEAGARRDQRTKLPVYSLQWVPVYEVSRQRYRALRLATAASALPLIVPALLVPLFALFLPIWAALGVAAVLGYFAWRTFKRCETSLYSSFPKGKFREGDLIFPDHSLLELDRTCTWQGRTEF
ncbi:hypothetical protein [Leifsonia sp. ALI-44-B]|uniref:hypothetical protein n=1 Tax=Leifsonia sp. ALI-44-B TaxID=1933776 RepID=UPI00117B1F12|nr:hypothetical protein [Leifsonia sp. ALI-44-B]